MRRRLFETDKLTLEKAIWMCRAMEGTSADLQLWSGKKEGEVAAITQGAKGKKKQEYKQPPQKQQSQRRTRGKCGQQHQRVKCPAYGKTCFNPLTTEFFPPRQHIFMHLAHTTFVGTPLPQHSLLSDQTWWGSHTWRDPSGNTVNDIHDPPQAQKSEVKGGCQPDFHPAFP